jgi:hypothetical protein
MATTIINSIYNTTLNNDVISLILYKQKGLTHPTALIMQKQINMFLWLNGDYKPIDLKNAEADSGIFCEAGKLSYFVHDTFYNSGFV